LWRPHSVALGRIALFLGLLAMFAVASVSAGAATAPGGPQYAVIDLGDFCEPDSPIGCDSDPTTEPWQESAAYGINNRGQVVGSSVYSSKDGSVGGFLWQNDRLTAVYGPSPNGFNSSPRGVNESSALAGFGDIAGFGGLESGLYQNGAWKAVPTLGFTPSPFGDEIGSVAYGLNNPGAVVGAALTADVPAGAMRTHAFAFRAGVIRDLGSLAGRLGSSEAFAVNNAGVVVGRSTLRPDGPYGYFDGAYHAFFYNGVMHDLGGAANSEATAINDAGQVVGDAGGRPFLYSGGAMHDLGTLGSDATGIATDINGAGQVVGCSGRGALARWHQDPVGKAFLYDGGRMVALDSLLPSGTGWTLFCATGINDYGQIVGFGRSPGGFLHGFLLNPVLAGDAQVERGVDFNPAGLAEAFRTTTTATTQITTADLYLDSRSTATRVTIGFYSDSANHPGRLLGTATIAAPQANGWNHVSLPPISVPKGSPVWIGILTPVGAGTIRFRDNGGGLGGAAPSETSAQTSLTALPAVWTTGKRYEHDGPVSAYGG
jgi:probable HAF family extracellular repeat protein